MSMKMALFIRQGHMGTTCTAEPARDLESMIMFGYETIFC